MQQVVGQLARPRVCPLEVLEDERDGHRRRERLDPLAAGAANVLGTALGERPSFVAETREQRFQMRLDRLGAVAEERLQLDPESGAHCERRGVLLEPEPVPQRLDHGQESELGAVGDTVSLQPDDGIRHQVAKLAQHACLPEAGVAEHEEHLAPTREEVVTSDREGPELVVAADERRRRDRLEPLHRTAETPDGHGLLASLDGDRVQLLEHEPIDEAPHRGLPGHDRTGLGDALETGGDVRRVAECDGLSLRAADKAHRHRPAVQADPDVEVRDPPGRLDVAGVLADDVNDVQRRSGGALGIVLVGHGDAEEGRDPVAHEGVDDAAELLDGSTHAAHALADQRLHLLGSQSLADRSRADHVGEQRRHGPKLVRVLEQIRLRRSGQLWDGTCNLCGCHRPVELRLHDLLGLGRCDLDLDDGAADLDRVAPSERRDRADAFPLTRVPLREPRSSTSSASPTSLKTAWRREIDGSSTVRSLGARPMVSWEPGSTLRPASGPLLITSTNTWTSPGCRSAAREFYCRPLRRPARR